MDLDDVFEEQVKEKELDVGSSVCSLICMIRLE